MTGGTIFASQLLSSQLHNKWHSLGFSHVQRDSRQGEPLSPFCFGDEDSKMLNKALIQEDSNCTVGNSQLTPIQISHILTRMIHFSRVRHRNNN